MTTTTSWMGTGVGGVGGVEDAGNNGVTDVKGNGGVEDAGVGGVEDAGDSVVEDVFGSNVEDAGGCQHGGEGALLLLSLIVGISWGWRTGRTQERGRANINHNYRTSRRN